MLGSVIGIEIGNNTIKLIEVIKKGTSLKVERFSLLETPKNCILDGTMHNIEPIYQTIAKEISQKKYKAKKAIILIQGNAIIIRNIVMAKQSEKVIRQLIAIRPEEYLPVDTAQYQIDFKIVREFEEKGEDKQEVVLVAAPNSIVLPMVNLIESLKWVPIQISIPSQALEKVFGQQERMVDAIDADILVIDIGGKSTTVTIIAQGHAVLTRIIEFGVDVIHEAIDSSFISPEEQEMSKDAKKEYDEYLIELIKPQIEYNILSELERVLQFYYSRFENRPISKVYLIGGGANVEGIKTYIQDALNIDTKVFNTFSNVIEGPGLEFEEYRRFFVNILGAIHGI
ncbi:type IV pilus assembly protein PilM [Cellulosilyticum sp. I15G10I2]|uniref:type IV pilus assembly protein PilM n=1 Tax=Cellulosilyticum sp. I15G10I2 TaxID=1892843 RepID=UPI00085C3C60|nr:type IV pilus assembly protein PilM [Cellulosilyticum sp. I15G10I2]